MAKEMFEQIVAAHMNDLGIPSTFLDKYISVLFAHGRREITGLSFPSVLIGLRNYTEEDGYVTEMIGHMKKTEKGQSWLEKHPDTISVLDLVNWTEGEPTLVIATGLLGIAAENEDIEKKRIQLLESIGSANRERQRWRIAEQRREWSKTQYPFYEQLLAEVRDGSTACDGTIALVVDDIFSEVPEDIKDISRALAVFQKGIGWWQIEQLDREVFGNNQASRANSSKITRTLSAMGLVEREFDNYAYPNPVAGLILYDLENRNKDLWLKTHNFGQRYFCELIKKYGSKYPQHIPLWQREADYHGDVVKKAVGEKQSSVLSIQDDYIFTI
jgi:hypothetical protein